MHWWRLKGDLWQSVHVLSAIFVIHYVILMLSSDSIIMYLSKHYSSSHKAISTTRLSYLFAIL